MVKHTTAEGEERLITSPEPDYMFERGDVMLVLGSEKDVPYLKRGRPRKGA